MGAERIGCQAATVQALRFHFNLRVRDVAKLLRISTQRVSLITMGGVTVLSWEERKFKDEAIKKAKLVLYATNDHLELNI